MDVKLVVAAGGQKNQTIRLRSEESVLGRRRGSDVRIPSSSVSRRHCRLIFRDELLMVEDLGSANGTFVNGKRVAKLLALRPGDKLQVGAIQFIVNYPLSQNAVERLLAMEKAGDASVLEVAEVEVLSEGEQDLDEAIPVEDDGSPTVQVEILEEDIEADAEAKRAAELEEAEAASNASNFLANPWNAPAGQDLRDILSELEKDK